MINKLLYIQAFAVALLLALPARAATSDGLAVVELFTSQGCNSCPPADKLASQLADQPGVLVLSWNVDYWDMLGWPDTLASPEKTARQRAYNKRLKRRGVYTPQMVIGGRTEAVGSDRRAVEAAINDASFRSGVLQIREDVDHVRIILPQDARARDAVVILVRYDFEKVVDIGGGENRGRTITYVHPVRNAEAIAVWNGAAAELVIEKRRFCKAGNAILVQQGAGGPILHAAVVGSVK